MSTSILIVGDEKTVAADLELRLDELGYSVLGVLGTEGEALSEAIERHPSVVLVDISVPGVEGLEAATRIRAKADIPIIFVTGHSEPAKLFPGLTVGPGAYLVRPYSERELVVTIELALCRHDKQTQLRKMAHSVLNALNDIEDPVFMTDAKGNVRFVNKPAQQIMERKGATQEWPKAFDFLSAPSFDSENLPEGMDTLSRRENEVLLWFLRGFSTETIGRHLRLSPQTIRNHIKNVCRKLNVRGQVELRELFARKV